MARLFRSSASFAFAGAGDMVRAEHEAVDRVRHKPRQSTRNCNKAVLPSLRHLFCSPWPKSRPVGRNAPGCGNQFQSTTQQYLEMPARTESRFKRRRGRTATTTLLSRSLVSLSNNLALAITLRDATKIPACPALHVRQFDRDRAGDFCSASRRGLGIATRFR